MKRALLCVSLALLWMSSQVFAWGTKEHILLTRLAVLEILDDPTAPDGLKTFLRQATPDLTDRAGAKTMFLTARFGAEPKDLKGLSFWVVEPDIRANGDRESKVEPFGVPERALHFIDLEYLHEPGPKRAYQHDLSSKFDIAHAPRDLNDPRYRAAGFLPFAVERAYGKLVDAIKADRLHPAPAGDKDDDYALRWAGFLAHYVQDNLQPQHATADYRSRSYFADKRKAPNVHAEVEWRMNDDEKDEFPTLRADYWSALEASLETLKPGTIKLSDDLWLETMQTASTSYDHLPLIGLAAMHASGQAGTPEAPTGPVGELDTEKFFRFGADTPTGRLSVLKMKANQQALAIRRTAAILRKAWQQAHPAP